MNEREYATIQEGASEDEGFIRLSADECRENLEDIIAIAMEGDRILLQQAGEDVAAIVPNREFERLESLMERLKPSQYLPEEEEYYESDRAIHCMYPDEIIADFDEILEAVKLDREVFGLLPPRNLQEQGFDIFMPVAILMSADEFWVPEYVIQEKEAGLPPEEDYFDCLPADDIPIPEMWLNDLEYPY